MVVKLDGTDRARRFGAQVARRGCAPICRASRRFAYTAARPEPPAVGRA